MQFCSFTTQFMFPCISWARVAGLDHLLGGVYVPGYPANRRPRPQHRLLAIHGSVLRKRARSSGYWVPL